MDHVGWTYVPQGLTSAQLNLSYCLATYLIEDDCFVDQFTEDKVADPQRMALAKKVGVFHDPEITAQGAKFRHSVRVDVELSDGTRMVRTVEAARGSEKRFARDDEIADKFDQLAARVLPDRQRAELRDAVLG